MDPRICSLSPTTPDNGSVGGSSNQGLWLPVDNWERNAAEMTEASAPVSNRSGERVGSGPMDPKIYGITGAPLEVEVVADIIGLIDADGWPAPPANTRFPGR